MPTDDLLLRRAVPGDLAAVAEVHLAAREAAVPQMPPLVHSREEVLAFHTGLDLAQRDLWVAESEEIVGYVELKSDWLDDLYVRPDHQGQRVGSALLDVAKAERPEGFQLWVFQSNLGARRFYERHDLVELETTDGSGNEERAADVRMAWPGEQPLAFFRRCIDDVDDQLGELLARRAALTRAIQHHKADQSRDPARERDVAARLAQRAPALGEERLARIVHAIVTESLDAAT